MEAMIDKMEEINMQIQDIATKSDNRLSKLENVFSRPDIVGDDNESSFKAFGDFIRNGEISRELKSLSGLEDVSGGYTIIPELYKKIIGHLDAKSIMRKLSSHEKISTNALDLLIEEDNFNCRWERESAPREETAHANFAKRTIMVHELYAQPKATQKLLDDSAINISNWLVSRLSDSFCRAENTAFINGDGDNKPRGILTYNEEEIEQKTVAEEGQITFEDLLNLMNHLEEAYLSRASFLMHRSTLLEIQKLKDNNGRFLWQPSLTQGKPGFLLGVPVYCVSDMPSFGAGKLCIALADFKEAYKIVDRADINIMRDPFTDKPFVKFYAVKRIGADVVNKNSIKLLKC